LIAFLKLKGAAMTTQLPSSITIKCGGCGKQGNQQVLNRYVHSDVFEYAYGYVETEVLFYLSRCSRCDAINFSVHIDEAEIQVLWPTPPKEVDGLPETVAQAYKAAQAVRKIDANAFAVLLGRVLEVVCLDRNATGNSLYDQLQDLADNGEIPARLVEMAHQLRALRNIGAHATLGELTPAEVPIIDDLCRAILEYVYTAPSRIQQVEERIQRLRNRER
jgi:hypothetical protein